MEGALDSGFSTQPLIQIALISNFVVEWMYDSRFEMKQLGSDACR